MLIEILTKLYERDLAKLKGEIEQYSNSSDLWLTEEDITNSAGNLTLHLVGNLKHFLGAVLADSGYLRDREREFSDKGIPREDLVTAIDETRAVVKSVFAKLSDDDLAKDYPILVFDEPMSTAFFLVHLATHLNYHLGQINYHRRLLSKQLKGESTPG